MAVVNELITDSATRVNTKVVGDTPAMALGNLMTSTGQALGNAGHEASAGNQQVYISLQATTVQGVNSLIATGSAVTGRTSVEIIEKE